MGAGTRLAKTRVTRCLIGVPGITYFYLGLRMFAHPWSGKGASAACKAMGELSSELGARLRYPAAGGGMEDNSAPLRTALCFFGRPSYYGPRAGQTDEVWENEKRSGSCSCFAISA